MKSSGDSSSTSAAGRKNTPGRMRAFTSSRASTFIRASDLAEMANEAAAAAIVEHHRRGLRMNTDLKQERIERARQRTPYQRGKLRMPACIEKLGRLVDRGIFEDSLAIIRIVAEPLHQEVVFRTVAADVTSCSHARRHNDHAD